MTYFYFIVYGLGFAVRRSYCGMKKELQIEVSWPNRYGGTSQRFYFL
jgi:hypothetical protein